MPHSRFRFPIGQGRLTATTFILNPPEICLRAAWQEVKHAPNEPAAFLYSTNHRFHEPSVMGCAISAPLAKKTQFQMRSHTSGSVACRHPIGCVRGGRGRWNTSDC